MKRFISFDGGGWIINSDGILQSNFIYTTDDCAYLYMGNKIKFAEKNIVY